MTDWERRAIIAEEKVRILLIVIADAQSALRRVGNDD